MSVGGKGVKMEMRPSDGVDGGDPARDEEGAAAAAGGAAELATSIDAQGDTAGSLVLPGGGGAAAMDGGKEGSGVGECSKGRESPADGPDEERKVGLPT